MTRAAIDEKLPANLTLFATRWACKGDRADGYKGRRAASSNSSKSGMSEVS
jgi:hypothetical protein